MKALVALQSACFVVLCALLFTRVGAPSAAPMLQQELQALRQDLRDLLASAVRTPSVAPSARLAAREMPVAAPPAAPARTPAPRVNDAELDLVARLDALEAAVRRLHVAAASGGATSAIADMARTRPVADWAALDRVHQQLQQDYTGTKSNLLLMSTAALLEAFGKPTGISYGDNRTWWTYQRGREYVKFIMADGLVIGVERSP